MKEDEKKEVYENFKKALEKEVSEYEFVGFTEEQAMFLINKIGYHIDYKTNPDNQTTIN